MATRRKAGAPASDVAAPAPDKGQGRPVAASPAKPKARIEKFEATRADGTVVVVTANLDTGERTYSDK